MTDMGLMDPDDVKAGLGDGTVLKILSGVQSGVEVSLMPGQYVLGSGDDDDIQIIDVSLAPGHLQLRVSPRVIQIRAAAGPVRSGNGIALDPDSDWHEVEPLDILTVGTTLLALGHSTAAWTSVTDIDEETAKPEEEELPAERLWGRDLLAKIDLRKQAMPLVALVIVVGLAIWYLTTGSGGISDNSAVTLANIQEVRAVLAPLTFARDIEVRQEVDGTIYATGYVESTVERRAVAGAIDETGIPVHQRIWVLQSMRQEIEGLIAAQKRQVTFDISRKGVVTLNGIIPDDTQAERFISVIREGIPGVTSVQSNLRTPSSLLAEIEKLAQSSSIKPWVMFRFDQGLIEATGALPADKTDSWLGFLQVYARRFAHDVGLRSFVQLQDINIQSGGGGAPAHAITIGAPVQNAGDVEVDIARIQEGNFTPNDVLIGATERQGANSSNQGANSSANLMPSTSMNNSMALPPILNKTTNMASELTAALQQKSAGIPTSTTQNMAGKEEVTSSVMPSLPRLAQHGKTDPILADVLVDTGQQSLAVPPIEEGGSVSGQPSSISDMQSLTVPLSGEGGTAAVARSSESSRPASDDLEATNPQLSDSTRLLLEQWRDGRLQQGTNANSLMQALERLSRENGGSEAPSRLARQQLHDRYLPAASNQVYSEGVCWPSSQLTPKDAATALFWLDILSVGRELSLTSFDTANQLALMEVALNPRRATSCIARAYPDNELIGNSVFLREVKRNPAFIRFILRDIAAFPLDISGASAVGDARFLQTRAGLKIQEGSSPDNASRLLMVGELGAVIEVPRGLSSVVYGQDLVWMLD